MASAGTFAAADRFSKWVDTNDANRVSAGDGAVSRNVADAGAASEEQPRIGHFFATGDPVGIEVRYDGKTSGLTGSVSSRLDFDLPVDSFRRSTTFTFGPALFKMDLNFLEFDEAASTYSFRENWNSAPGAGLISGGAISLTDFDQKLSGTPFDPASLIPRSLYDIEGAPVVSRQWGRHQQDASLLSAVVMGYDLDEFTAPEGMSAVLGTLSGVEMDGAADRGDLGLAGVIAMFALGGAALFITLEITRDKFDNYR